MQEQGVRAFFKQWGSARPKSGGHEADGRTYDEYPARRAAPRAEEARRAAAARMPAAAR